MINQFKQNFCFTLRKIYNKIFTKKFKKPEEDELDLSVTYKGKITILNKKMLKRQGITDLKVIKALKVSHLIKFEIFEKMENTDDPQKLHQLAIELEQLEFAQQTLWGFEQNSNYHYWWKVPKCTCANMDNYDAYGTKYRHVNLNCPVHGKLNN